MNRDVTVVIASIPPRADMLARALASCAAQTHLPKACAIAVDVDRQGDGPTRNRALAMAQTEWVAFLDDDDELFPHHLQRCLDEAEATGADVIVPWFEVIGGSDPIGEAQRPRPGPDGCVRSADGRFASFAVTNLVRTKWAQSQAFGVGLHDDYHYWRALSAAGATFRMIPDVTWAWHHDSGNTSGEPDRW